MGLPETTALEILKSEATGEAAEPSHALLLEEAYSNLTHELEKNGNSPELENLRKHYFERFLTYWQGRISEYRADFGGRVRGGEIQDGEANLLVKRGVNHRTLRPTLDAYQTGPDGRDHVNIELNHDGTFDFYFPPTIHSFIKAPNGRETIYHFEFRDGMVSLMQRSKYHIDPSGARSPINQHVDINFGLLNVNATEVSRT